MGHQVTMKSDLPIMSWVLSDLPSHKVRCAEQKYIIRLKWYIYDWAKSDPEDTRKEHEEVTQAPTASTPVTLPSTPNCVLRGSDGVHYNLLAEEEKTGVWFMVVQHVIQAPSEVDSYSIATHFWDSHERCQWRKIFVVGRTLGSTHDSSIYLEREMAGCFIVHLLMSWMVKDFVKSMLRKTGEEGI